VAGVLADLREKLKPFYSEIGRRLALIFSQQRLPVPLPLLEIIVVGCRADTGRMNILDLLLACAAALIGYRGELPPYLWLDREPTKAECQRALRSDNFFQENRYTLCYAVTGILPAYGHKPGRVVVIMPRNAAEIVKFIEAIRVLELGVPLQMSNERVYELSKRWRECSD
jgi:hypothetical protein